MQVRQHTWLGHGFKCFLRKLLRNLAVCFEIIMLHGKFLFCQDGGVSTGIHGAIYKCHLPGTFCTYASINHRFPELHVSDER